MGGVFRAPPIICPGGNRVMSVYAHNPILPGFYPDPSACAVGEDYYIVNSTFAYFPGLNVMHSRDLKTWEQIGNVLTRESQLPLNGAGVSEGLFAPTIRYYDGTFYVTCTNVSGGGNFVVTATDPAGPWSEPHYIKGADGIDPSLFFDNDGRCYYIGTHPNREGCRYDGDWYIYVCELDLNTFELKGEPKDIWNGALRNVIWPEGPHIYRNGNKYYLLHAEAGTGFQHAVSVARSDSVFGPYEGNPCNPIFTHRHLGRRYPIQCVGHGDMFRVANGDWYMVCLATRPLRGNTMLGRETFLTRVVWEDDWPLVNAGLGVMSDQLGIELNEWESEYSDNVVPGRCKDYDFTKMTQLGNEMLMLRNPSPDMYHFEEGKGLALKCGSDLLSSRGNVSFIGVRPSDQFYDVSCVLDTDVLYSGAAAGLCIFKDEKHSFRFEVSNHVGYVILAGEDGDDKLVNYRIDSREVEIIIRVVGLGANVFVRTGHEVKPIAANIDISSLSVENAGGFTGCVAGLYATDSNADRKEPEYAVFKVFSYSPIKLNTNNAD